MLHGYLSLGRLNSFNFSYAFEVQKGVVMVCVEVSCVVMVAAATIVVYQELYDRLNNAYCLKT